MMGSIPARRQKTVRISDALIQAPAHTADYQRMSRKMQRL
jgi:hypothetical protein